jgi:excisionase family DNA binding protein
MTATTFETEAIGDTDPIPVIETEPSPNYCGDEAPTTELRWPPPPVKPPAATMTVPELAERWGVHAKTIYAMIERKQLAALRVGRLIRVARSVVENCEQQASVAPGGRKCR